MNNPFPVRLRAASIVPRWSIIHRIQQDYLSSHSWFVSVYAYQIAQLIGWKGNLGWLLWAALTHDLDELITGDIVAPAKRNIVDPANASRFISRKLTEVLPGFPVPNNGDKFFGEIKPIIKAADQLDALLYAIGEEALGNRIIAARIPSCYDKLREAWYKLPYEGETIKSVAGHDAPARLIDLWLGPVQAAIEAHKNPNSYDIGK